MFIIIIIIIIICFFVFFTAVIMANLSQLYHINYYYNLLDDEHILKPRLGSAQSSIHKLAVTVLNTNLQK